ncbi:MAG TPA: saccharopine dehydrogenase NADP-binding domain-containing protein [Trebonia sp.]
MTRVLIVGGYGLVGGWVARHLAKARPELELVVGGRNPAAAAALAAETGAEVARVDTADAAASLGDVGHTDLVISAVTDPNDDLLRAALRCGAAHIGIVRTADTLGPTAMAAAILAQRPALVLGHWQAGAITYAALAAANGLSRVDRIELAGLYHLADPAGLMAQSASGGFFTQALLRRDGEWVHVPPAENGRTVTRTGQPPFAAQPMSALDVPGLAAVTGSRWLRFDLGVGDSAGTAAGGPASHEVYADVWGEDRNQQPCGRRTIISDPQGQAHLTALGVLIGAERVLGLDGAAPPPSGLVFPETAIDPQQAIARLRDFGVRVESEDAPAAAA